MNESFRENTASVLEQIKAGFNDLPKAVSESVLRNCEVTGAVGVTRDQVEQITEDNFSAIGIVSIINIFFFSIFFVSFFFFLFIQKLICTLTH